MVTSTALTGGRLMAVGWWWGVGRAVVFFWRWCGHWFGGGWSLVGCGAVMGGCFCLGRIIARIWGVFRCDFGEFLDWVGVGGVGIGSYATGENL